jgi:hypothetical protein
LNPPRFAAKLFPRAALKLFARAVRPSANRGELLKRDATLRFA